MSLEVKLDNEGRGWSLMAMMGMASNASTPVVMDVRVGVPLAVMPSSMQMGICAMLSVWVGVSTVIVIVNVTSPSAVCFPRKREGGSN